MTDQASADQRPAAAERPETAEPVAPAEVPEDAPEDAPKDTAEGTSKTALEGEAELVADLVRSEPKPSELETPAARADDEPIEDRLPEPDRAPEPGREAADFGQEAAVERGGGETEPAADRLDEPDAEAFEPGLPPAAADHEEPPAAPEPPKWDERVTREIAAAAGAPAEAPIPDEPDESATGQASLTAVGDDAADRDGSLKERSPAESDDTAPPDTREAARARSFAAPAAAAGKAPRKSRPLLLILIVVLVLCLTLLALFAWLRPILMAPEAESPAAKELSVEELTEIERLLSELLIDSGPIDGVVDDQTREAIRFYQESGGLPVDGEPTAALLNDLREVVGSLGN